MDIEYLGPTRYDFGDSDSEEEYAPSGLSATPATFTLRLLPGVTLSPTLVISLLPWSDKSTSSGLAKKIGTIYAPCIQPNRQMPIGNVVANSALGHIVEGCDGVLYVLASAALPLELQHGWVRTVFEKLGPQRVVVLDELENAGEFGSPAVLASAVIVGLTAAVLNYADTYGIPCRHVRGGNGLVGAADIDAMFTKASSASLGKHTQHAESRGDTIKHEVSTSLYV
ncbi:hypothetical protein LPJ56_001849 [Coemansia sp. RSA 2599]|nr:hypothetical protein LPJ75_001480 [Coemansia sp. RSA 2598]KAJ1827092.1 hypothetical protein LPJ56_001849 [Coemansia sp. RSA 2599]